MMTPSPGSLCDRSYSQQVTVQAVCNLKPVDYTGDQGDTGIDHRPRRHDATRRNRQRDATRRDATRRTVLQRRRFCARWYQVPANKTTSMLDLRRRTHARPPRSREIIIRQKIRPRERVYPYDIIVHNGGLVLGAILSKILWHDRLYHLRQCAYQF